MSQLIIIGKRDGQYRNNCECGARSESQDPFDPELGKLEKHMVDFMNLHSGQGHMGVTEFMSQGRWVEGGRWSPMTNADWSVLDAMGGLK